MTKPFELTGAAGPAVVTNVVKYAGPPGTGKTTTLLNELEKILRSGVDPERIVFTTFTRAGAYEARDRTVERFNLSTNRLPYFKTLHALCFSLLPTRGVMAPSDWFSIARQIGVSFSVKFSEDEGLPRGQTKGDYLMSLWSLSRVMRIPLEQVFDRRKDYLRGFDQVTFSELNHFIETVRNYKVASGKIDYTDMLELWLTEGVAPGASHVIVDEAQDFSPIQWACVRKLAKGAKFLLIAGDDDQAIHEWNGADPHAFIKYPADRYTVLNQSHRVPSKVHTLAERIAARIKSRLPKEYRPREEPGVVESVTAPEQLDLEAKGSWLILARNQKFLERLVGGLKHAGYLFKAPPGLTNEPIADIVTAIRAWTLIQSGKSISPELARLLYTFMSTRDRIAHGFKMGIRDARGLQSYETLTKNHGLLVDKTAKWDVALDMIGTAERAYLLAAEKMGELEHEKPRIELSTIHGSKGREADNVALLTDMAHPTWEGFAKNPDAEHRVWYVGVTRARKALWIVRPQTDKFYDL